MMSEESDQHPPKLWSHEAAQRPSFQGSLINVPGIGRGHYFPSPEGNRIEQAEPEGCESRLLDWIKDEQEALSIRYGAGALIIVHLSSGRIGLFGPDRQLLSIVDGQISHEMVARLAKESIARTRGLMEQIRNKRREIQGLSPQSQSGLAKSTDLSLEDLGL